MAPLSATVLSFTLIAIIEVTYTRARSEGKPWSCRKKTMRTSKRFLRYSECESISTVGCCLIRIARGSIGPNHPTVSDTLLQK